MIILNAALAQGRESIRQQGSAPDAIISGLTFAASSENAKSSFRGRPATA
jgi:hypothetical protein